MKKHKSHNHLFVTFFVIFLIIVLVIVLLVLVLLVHQHRPALPVALLVAAGAALLSDARGRRAGRRVSGAAGRRRR